MTALCAPTALFVPATYFVGVITGDQYYFGQIYGELFVLAAVTYLAAYGSGGQRLVLAAALLATVGLVLSYPAWLPPVALALAVAVVMRSAAWRHKVLDAGAFAAPLALLLAVFLPGRMQIGIGIVRWEGIAAQPTVQVFGWPLLAISAVGLVAVLCQARRHWTVLLLLGVCVAQAIALYVAAIRLDLTADYHFYKSMYLLVYPLALLAASGVAVLGARLLAGRWSVVVGAVAVFMLVGLAWQAFSSDRRIHPVHVIHQDDVAVAQWARSHVDTMQIGYRLDYGISSYWLHVAILGNKRVGPIPDSLLELWPMTFDEWLHGGAWPTYFLVHDVGEIPPNAKVALVYQSGASALLARDVAPAQQVVPTQPMRAMLGELVQVEGFSVPSRHIVPGGPFEVSIHWSVRHWPRRPVPLRMYVHLLDSSNRVVGALDREPFDGRYGSLRWPIGVTNTETFTIPVAADAQPGRYYAQVGMYPIDTLVNLPVRSGEGKTLDRLLIGPFKVPLPAETARPSHELQRVFAERIALLGYDLPTLQVRSGETIALRLYWQAVRQMDVDYTVFVHLVGADGKPVAQCDAQPRDGAYPTSIWDAGEVVAADCPIALPATLPSGRYTLLVGLYSWPSLQRLPVAGGGDSVEVTSVSIAGP